MRAVILAGGLGTRLKPYTATLPKPLVPVGDKPILEHVLHQLKQSGFDHVTIAVNHLAELIMAFFGDGSKWGLQIDYSLEDKPLSTIGPLTLIEDLPASFLVMNGDVLTDLDYSAFFALHNEHDNDVTVATYRRKQKIDFGVLESNDESRIIAFREKPEYDFHVSMGVYAVSRRVIDDLPTNEKYGFDNLMIDGIADGRKLVSHPHEGFWLDIGRPDDYEYANEKISELIP